MKLVRDNYTTIENLEREDDEPSPWDIGTWRNLEQVSDVLPSSPLQFQDTACNGLSHSRSC